MNKLQDCEKYIEEMKQQFTQSQVLLRDMMVGSQLKKCVLY